MKLLAINLTVALVLGLLALLGVEIYLRLTVPASDGRSIYEYTTATPRYKVMKPGASIVAWGEELRTNELGFRDATLAVPPKQVGERRIAILGDSVTVAAGVPYRSLYTTLVEERLRARFPGVKVMNLAVGGYNIVQYALVVEEVALALEPDLLVVALFPENDFEMEGYEHNRRVAYGLEPPASPSWYESLYVQRAYLERIASHLRSLLPVRPAPVRNRERDAEENSAAFDRIVKRARESGVAIVAILLPHTYDIGRQAKPFSRAHRLCEKHALPCLDLRQAFLARDVEMESVRLNALDTHPNAGYHAIVAEAAAPFLSEALRPAKRPF